MNYLNRNFILTSCFPSSSRVPFKLRSYCLIFKVLQPFGLFRSPPFRRVARINYTRLISLCQEVFEVFFEAAKLVFSLRFPPGPLAFRVSRSPEQLIYNTMPPS